MPMHDGDRRNAALIRAIRKAKAKAKALRDKRRKRKH